MQYYVVYQDWDIVRGPVHREEAESLVEDLEMVLEDTDYRVMDEGRVLELCLENPAAMVAGIDG
jgi:hypothetical protein